MLLLLLLLLLFEFEFEFEFGFYGLTNTMVISRPVRVCALRGLTFTRLGRWEMGKRIEIQQERKEGKKTLQ